MLKVVSILICVGMYTVALIYDPVPLLILTALTIFFYLIAQWLVSTTPPNDTYDIYGKRIRPYTKEELDYLDRAILGKSRKEKKRILKNFTHL